MPVIGYPKLLNTYLNAAASKNNQFYNDFFNAFDLVGSDGFSKSAADYSETYDLSNVEQAPAVDLNALNAVASQWGLIGPFTVWGSSADVPLVQNPDQPATFNASNVPLVTGAWGFGVRLNNQWTIRLNQTSGIDPVAPNVYSVTFETLGQESNFGNDALPTGLYNFEVTFQTYTAANQATGSITITRVGDYVEPQPASFGIIGSAVGSWDSDVYTFTAAGSDGTYNLYTVQAVIGAGTFKVRGDNDWGWSVGYTQITDNGDGSFEIILSKSGPDIPGDPTIPAGTYDVVLKQEIVDVAPQYILVLSPVV